MNSKNVVTISVIVAVAGLIIAVFVFFGGPKSGVSGGLQTVAPLSAQESNALSRDFLQALSSLNSLELNSAFFDDKAFKLLVDYSKNIKDEEVGRDNPFLPINGSVTPITQPEVVPVPPIKAPPVTSQATSSPRRVVPKPATGTSTINAF